jgi:tRNA wybutosine-synthesizing protein 4
MKGMGDCQGVSVIDFYVKNISELERDRIDYIEPFDEFEEWHLKCSHYALILGSNGEFCKTVVQSLLGSPVVNKEIADLSYSNQVVLKEFPLQFGSRFGHALCVNETNETLYVYGGFGESHNEKGRHRRLSTVEVVCLKSMTVNIVDYLDQVLSDRIHSTTCCVDGELLIIYGRGSPDKLFDLVLIGKDGDRFEQKELVLNSDHSKPQLRWRHASCKLKDDQIFIFGGRSFNSHTKKYEVLNDCYLLTNLVEFKRIEVSKVKNVFSRRSLWHFNNNFKIDEEVYKPRHSHSICKWGKTLIVSGGLDKHENILDDVLLIDSESFQVKKLNVQNTLPR